MGIIAWTYLLHAYYREQDIEYRYFEQRGKRKFFDKTKHGAYKYWELERCLDEKKSPINKITTSSQLRSGFEFLYLKHSNVDIRKELLERIFVSHIKLNSFVDRFYLEDYLVGKYMPWFNLDSER